MKVRASSDPRVRTGLVVATRGRGVTVRDSESCTETYCVRAGCQAVVGDRVRWQVAQGSGGKLIDLLERDTVLSRTDWHGREQILAANLGGVLVAASAAQPAYRPGLVDRYEVAASVAGLAVALVLTKTDLGVASEVASDLNARRARGVAVIESSTSRGEGLDDLRAFLAEHAREAPWVLVGHSGVGKTSLIAALLPGEDVGPIGEISEFWDQGKHTTTASRIFDLASGGSLADSPGIRTFLPGRLEPEQVRAHFPGTERLVCRYRDCLHRDGEEGCVAADELDADTLSRYRHLLDEVCSHSARARSRRGTQGG